ncbi:MAG TPA: acyl-CoA dehydrogenase family protein [Mycobacteriales bacterium]|nr:acyl-CoA dehydrogenase family protein [Mycobacteriales bacterium]
MNFAFSDEQEELRRTVRRFLDERSPESEVRRLMDTDEGFDRDVWAQLSSQLSLPGLAVPEEYDGAGFGYVELAVVFEEMGRALFCGPYFATVALAASTLLAVDDVTARKDLLPGIARGETIATLAITESDGAWRDASIATTADAAGDGWRLSGTKDFVVDGHIADLLLVVARSAAGLSLYAVDASAAGVERELLHTLDETRKLARVRLTDTPARLIGIDGEAWPVLERVLDLASVALALESVGGAQRCLDMAVEYAKVRVQFGRPIGSFQAVKHRCADMLVDVEGAKSAAYYAAWCAAERNDELPISASLAKAFCTEIYAKAAADNIQVHGGIGFTWEHPAHLYLKRAKSSELLLGDPATHRDRLGAHLGI